ncbi:MAG: DUF4440 domain-containing protein [Candidatus Riflebacteria bacterium]|nr:DUF4440 domain-containing protein [Candidatus Riflebacteria bacterium]
MTPEELDVWNVVRSINALWTTGRVDELGDHFHPRMIAITPADREPLVGKEACIDSWRRFTRLAKGLSWVETDPRVEIHGDTAVVAYTYCAACEMDGRPVELRGRDLFVMHRERGRWWVVADQFSPFPARE